MKEVQVFQVYGSTADVMDIDNKKELHRSLVLENKAVKDQIQRGDIVIVNEGMTRIIRKR